MSNLTEHSRKKMRYWKLGSRNPMSKLSANEVLKIRKFQGLIGATLLARKFGVAKTTIEDIWTRKIWSHI